MIRKIRGIVSYYSNREKSPVYRAFMAVEVSEERAIGEQYYYNG